MSPFSIQPAFIQSIFQYRIQLCETPEQTISHSQLFSALETIGKQISNVNARLCVDIFGCVCVFACVCVWVIVDWWIKQIELDLKKIKACIFRCQSALLSSHKSTFLCSLLSEVSMSWKKKDIFLTTQPSFCSRCYSGWHFSSQAEQWKATMRYLGKATALLYWLGRGPNVPLTKKRLKYQTCLGRLWSLWPQPKLEQSTYIIVYLCEQRRRLWAELTEKQEAVGGLNASAAPWNRGCKSPLVAVSLKIHTTPLHVNVWHRELLSGMRLLHPPHPHPQPLPPPPLVKWMRWGVCGKGRETKAWKMCGSIHSSGGPSLQSKQVLSTSFHYTVPYIEPGCPNSPLCRLSRHSRGKSSPSPSYSSPTPLLSPSSCLATPDSGGC